LGQVGQGGGIQSGGSELPSDGVWLVLELHFLNLCRKSGELGGVTDIPSSKDRLEIQKSSSRPFLTKKFFFLEIVMIEGATSLGSKPRGVPKHSGFSIVDGEVDGSIYRRGSCLHHARGVEWNCFSLM
jgi:hypothetical protein